MKKNKMLNLGLVVGLLITLISMGGCVPGGEPGEGGSMFPLIIFLIFIFGMFYFLMIRPQRKKQKEHQEMTTELRKGDKVITAGGIYGEIESLSQDNIVLKVESGATIRIARTSVVGKRER